MLCITFLYFVSIIYAISIICASLVQNFHKFRIQRQLLIKSRPVQKPYCKKERIIHQSETQLYSNKRSSVWTRLRICERQSSQTPKLEAEFTTDPRSVALAKSMNLSIFIFFKFHKCVLFCRLSPSRRQPIHSPYCQPWPAKCLVTTFVQFWKSGSLSLSFYSRTSS